MRTRNLAIVFVDLAGFTRRTAEQTRAESASWLEDFQSLVLPLALRFRGRVVKTIGDALLLVFESPTDALLFGMAAQDRIFEHNRFADERRCMAIRVAANVGEVRLRKGDVFGEAVNIAARIEELAPAGEIWFSEAVYLAMNKSEVAAEKLGPRKLKGIPEPVILYQVPKASSYPLAAGAVSTDQGGGYPYGGSALSRLPPPGPVWLLDRLRRGMVEKAGLLLDSARALAPAGGSRRASRCMLVVVGLLLAALLLWGLWPVDRFAEVAADIEAGEAARAIEKLKFHPGRGSPEGKAWLAHALLSLPEPEVEQAWEHLSAALQAEPTLLVEARVRRDVVRCLDRQDARAITGWLYQGPAEKLLDELLEGSAHKRYFLRWNSIRVLEKLGKLDRVDLGQAYIYDLEFAGSCSTRKRAAQKLARLREKRALEPLRRAKQKGFLENLCMGDALDDAIRAIE